LLTYQREGQSQCAVLLRAGHLCDIIIFMEVGVRHHGEAQMKCSRYLIGIVFAAVLGALLITNTIRAAADSLSDMQPEKKKPQQQNQIKRLQRQEHIDRLNKDQNLSQFQRQLDELNHKRVVRFQAEQQHQLNQLRRQLDDVKIEQKLKQVQTDLQLNHISREQNPVRKQVAIGELQRQQQLDFLREQQQKLQISHDLDRLRSERPLR